MFDKSFFWLLGLLSVVISSIDVAAQPLSPPFVNKVVMTVVDPEAYSSELANIDSFRHLAKSADGRIFATFKAGSSKKGILIFNPKSLEVESVYWLKEAENKGRFEWCGLVSLGESGMAGLCCEQVSNKNSGRKGYLVRYLADEKERWLVRDVNVPETPSAIAYLPQIDALACLTKPSNSFFIYDLNKGVIKVHRVLFDFVPYSYPHCRALYHSSDGGLYGSYKGRLFCYYTDIDFFEYLGLMRCEYGHLSEVALTAMAGDGKGLLVGGTSGDGYLFTVDTETRKVRPWGKPTDGTQIRKLVYSDSSGFWGLAAVPGQSCRLFHFEPAKQSLTDLGIPAGIMKTDGRTWTWHAFDVSDMVVLDDGRILLAESAKRSKLLVFDPSECRD